MWIVHEISAVKLQKYSCICTEASILSKKWLNLNLFHLQLNQNQNKRKTLILQWNIRLKLVCYIKITVLHCTLVVTTEKHNLKMEKTAFFLNLFLQLSCYCTLLDKHESTVLSRQSLKMRSKVIWCMTHQSFDRDLCRFTMLLWDPKGFSPNRPRQTLQREYYWGVLVLTESFIWKETNIFQNNK